MDMPASHEEIQRCVSCSKSNLHHIASVFAGRELFTRVSTCLNCGLVFRSYRWTLKETERRYWVFDKELDTDWESVTNDAHEARRYKRHKRNLKWVEQHGGGRNARVLDIACGPGTGLVPFREAGYSVLGIDLHPARVRYAREKYGIEVVQGIFESHDFQDRVFDVIICSHFLEHAHQPLNILQKARGLLSDGGVLYVEVPNHFNYASFSDALYMAHNNSFTPLSLRNVLQIAGFRTVAKHKPQTRFHPGALEHIGVIAIPDNVKSVQAVNPDGSYLDRVVNACLKSIGWNISDTTRCSHIRYLFPNADQIEAHLHKFFAPRKIRFGWNGELVAWVEEPHPWLKWGRHCLRECLAKCAPLEKACRLVRKRLSQGSL